MKSNQQIIRGFYEAFQNKDASAMQDYYAESASFNDPVFTGLNALEVRSMWAMLLKSGKDLRIEFDNIQNTENGGTAEWTAYYTFSATGNRVINKVSASFIIQDGKITRHQDYFNFYSWARQSLGIPGLLLGWSTYLKNKVRNKARTNLKQYMGAVVNPSKDQ
jgi:ketosteroid isomerase-like protein